MDQHPTSNDNDDCHHLQSTEECPQNRGGGSALSSNSPSDKEDSEAQHNNTNNTTQKTDDGSSSGESENDPTDAKKKRRRRRKRTRRKKQKKPGVPVDAVDLYRVFDTDMTTLYTIPHQLVSYTSGSDRYVRHDRTPNWLKKQIAEDENGGQPLRFYLCPAYAAAAAATAAATPTAKPQCASGRKCPHVHADVRCTTADDAPSAVVVETTHIHTKAQDMKGQTHARGTQIPIHDRGAGRVSEVASELVVRTKGSEDWFKTPSALRRRVYHCRHFNAEEICIRGSDCVFFHVLDATLVPKVVVPVPPSPIANDLSEGAEVNNNDDEEEPAVLRLMCGGHDDDDDDDAEIDTSHMGSTGHLSIGVSGSYNQPALGLSQTTPQQQQQQQQQRYNM
eukprot:PhM_4_TR14191/c3_g1_i7/m.28003